MLSIKLFNVYRTFFNYLLHNIHYQCEILQYRLKHCFSNQAIALKNAVF